MPYITAEVYPDVPPEHASICSKLLLVVEQALPLWFLDIR